MWVHTFPKGICPKVSVMAWRVRTRFATIPETSAVTIAPRGHSLSLYIYIYMCVCVCVCVYVCVSVYIYIIIIIIISCWQHGYPWPSLATPPYRSSPLVGLQDNNLYPHIAVECTFVLVVLLLRGHVWGSIRVHLLWVHLCFSSMFIGWPRYSQGMWLNEVYFST